MPSPELALVAPLSGPVIPLEAVPDPVFAGRLLGDGLAIEPLDGTLVAPCDGTVSQLHRAGHALTLTAENGAQILLHIGVDTVALGGQGFSPKVSVGERVRTGQALIAFEADTVARAAPCLQTMILLANGEAFSIDWRAAGRVEAGASCLMTVRLRNLAALQAPGNGAGEVTGRFEGAAEGAGSALPSAVARVAHAGGIHARPAALVQAAARPFEGSEVTVRFGDKHASAKSVVGLMSLGVGEGEQVTVSARGPSALSAVQAVVAALEQVAPAAKAPAGPADPPAPPAPPRRAGRGLSGVCASPGVAVGRAVRLDAVEPEVAEAVADPASEQRRLAEALAHVGGEIAEAIRQAEARGARQESDIFAAHQALLEDPEIVAEANRAIAAGKSAGFAYRAVVRAHAAVLEKLGNPLLAERVTDLRELERRVLRAVSGEALALPTLFEESVLLADDVGPSELTRLAGAEGSTTRLVGLCTARGGATSHVAILARSLGIPALVAVGPELLAVTPGAEVLVDAGEGYLDPSPSPEALRAAREEMAARAKRRAAAEASAQGWAQTRDGRRVEVAANIANPQDAREAVRHGADGVGLLRTELLFIDRQDAPSESEQRAAYQAVVDALAGRPAIIRTLDVGNDKPLPYLPMPPEPNPALGLRGIRSRLSRPEVLDVQLRALLGVEPAAACRVMLPMIADASELLEVKERLGALARQLGVTALPQLGVMIEVPSAALLADQLAEHADFLSIGTNDLTQYTLAMDRCHPALAPFVDALHPGVLRLVRLAVEGAERHGKWVGVCGALASDLEAVPVLVGLGVAELSVSPSAVPEIKARVRGLDYQACRSQALELLRLPSAAQVRAKAKVLWPETAV